MPSLWITANIQCPRSRPLSSDPALPSRALHVLSCECKRLGRPAPPEPVLLVPFPLLPRQNTTGRSLTATVTLPWVVVDELPPQASTYPLNLDQTPLLWSFPHLLRQRDITAGAGVKSVSSGARFPGFEYWLCHRGAWPSVVIEVISLSKRLDGTLACPICKMGLIIGPTRGGCLRTWQCKGMLPSKNPLMWTIIPNDKVPLGGGVRSMASPSRASCGYAGSTWGAVNDLFLSYKDYLWHLWTPCRVVTNPKPYPDHTRGCRSYTQQSKVERHATCHVPTMHCAQFLGSLTYSWHSNTTTPISRREN